MGNSPYNGYTWNQREKITRARAKLEKAGDRGSLAYLENATACGICNDPGVVISWHSEDYSTPYKFSPPATFAICNRCHQRVHKRFSDPSEWKLFLKHVEAGGFAREFTEYPRKQRLEWRDTIAKETTVELPRRRRRRLTGSEWWANLTLDPESLVAAWARPRPLRPRPTSAEYLKAFDRVNVEPNEWALLQAHLAHPHRSATVRQLAASALNSGTPQEANLQYGSLARRLVETTGWEPERRKNGSSVWLSVIGDGWQPEGREFEWVMAPSLAEAVTKRSA